ncbi:unnamed protein product [Paramecium sonneborni]|uniref:DUF726 domain protein n=1 Tax=Paramecium sonneborni TaxID=65129 RepID=A0A8S1KQK8_9CILI|nr:unnamed protein product [Paramecium sonneborni]
MQQYIDTAQKVIPKNLTTYFNTFFGAFNTFQAMVNKFYPEYMDVQNAKNFQIDDPTIYSSIYQGDLQQENNKRKSHILKAQHYKIVNSFLDKYNFNRKFNSELIGKYFFNQSAKYCQIDLQAIINDTSGKFYEQSGVSDKAIWLNQALDEVSFILLEYFKGEFIKQMIFDEFVLSFAEIESFVYKKVTKKAKSIHKDTYMKLKSKLKQYFKEQHDTDLQVQILCNNIHQKNIQILDAKVLIENQYQIHTACFQDYVQKNYGFKLSNAIIYKYRQKLQKNFVPKIQESFVNYVNFNNKVTYNNYIMLIQFYFLQYFHNKKFIEGITNPEINTNLQYLIFSIDWIQSSVEADQAVILLQLLSQYNVNISQSASQIFSNEQFSVNVLMNFQLHNKQRCEKAQQWWNEQNEDTNLLVICQIYLILAGIRFQNGRLIFEDYEPAKRNALIQILRKLNNGKFQYFNFLLIKLCEKVTHNIQFQILRQINNRLKQVQQNESMEKPFEIDLVGTQVSFMLFGQGQNQAQINLEFYQKNELFFNIINPNYGSSQKQIKDNQFALFQKKFDGIKLKLIENQKKKMNANIILETVQPPTQIYFQVLSDNDNNSNVITLCISGFLSGDDNKLDQWGSLLHSCQGTVLGLHWNCSEAKDFFSMVQNLIPQLLGKLNIVGVALNAVGFISSNPYEKAHKEAERVGKYLAYLIAGHQLFGNRQINIICHSLGSVIVLECIKELDRLFEKNQKQFINEILIMGGVADIHKLQKRRWNAVAGRIYNIYSKKDQILNILLTVAKVFDSPCGLEPIYLGYKQVINCDFTQIVDGHSDYWNKMSRLLMQSDFNNDFKFMTNSIKEIF